MKRGLTGVTMIGLGGMCIWSARLERLHKRYAIIERKIQKLKKKKNDG